MALRDDAEQDSESQPLVTHASQASIPDPSEPMQAPALSEHSQLETLGSFLQESEHLSDEMIDVEKAGKPLLEKAPAAAIWHVLRCLYVSHALSKWGDRMWDFAAALFMLQIRPGSLLLVALYGLVEAGSVVALGVGVGKWIDAAPRMRVVRVALAVQNAAVVAACLAVAWLLAHQPGEPASWLVVTVLLSLTGVEGLATLATDVAIQRDWVVVVAEESPHGAGGGARLAQINASMRQIDLTCKLVAPAVAGLLVGATSPATAALLIATWNVASGLAEYALLASAYRALPALAAQSRPPAPLPNPLENAPPCCQPAEPRGNQGQVALSGHAHPEIHASGEVERNASESAWERLLPQHQHQHQQQEQEQEQQQEQGGRGAVEMCGLEGEGRATAGDSPLPAGARVPPGGSLSVAERPEMYLARDELEGRWRASAFGPLMRQVALQVADSGAGMVAGWRVYLRQEALLAAVSLALLYLTVLSFDALMTASLMWRGVPTVLLGAVRGVAALTGLVGTLVYPVLRDHIGTVRTGLWSTWMQWVFLVPCVGSVWAGGLGGAWLLMLAVVCSRVGLWSFDLAVTQLMQESVAESERGVVGGVQGALQSLLHMLTFALTIAFPRPQDFHILVVVSFATTTCAACLYTRHCFLARGHLLHLDALADLLFRRLLPLRSPRK